MTPDELGGQLVTIAQESVRTTNYNGIGPANASGRLADSIAYRLMPNAGIDVVVTGEAAKYVGTLRQGRGPTVSEGDGKLRPAIREWLDVKGIGNPDQREGISYAITKTIHKEGNLVHRNGLAPTNIWNGLVAPEVLKSYAAVVVAQLVNGELK